MLLSDEEIEIIKHWLRLINEFPLEYVATKIVEELKNAEGTK